MLCVRTEKRIIKFVGTAVGRLNAGTLGQDLCDDWTVVSESKISTSLGWRSELRRLFHFARRATQKHHFRFYGLRHGRKDHKYLQVKVPLEAIKFYFHIVIVFIQSDSGKFSFLPSDSEFLLPGGGKTSTAVSALCAQSDARRESGEFFMQFAQNWKSFPLSQKLLV